MKTAEQRKIDDRPCRTSNEDLMNRALKNYEEASRVAHHWDSNIPKAIKFYFKHKEIEQGEETKCPKCGGKVEPTLYAYAESQCTKCKYIISEGERQFKDTDKRKRASWNDVKEKYLEFHKMDSFTENMAIDIDFGYWLVSEYASQSGYSEVTDEEIDEFIESHPGNMRSFIIDTAVSEGFREGAKAMRDGKIGEQMK